MTLLYWRNETSGKLAQVVYKWVQTDLELTPDERDAFSQYLRMWAFYEGFKEPPGSKLASKFASLRENFDEVVTRGDRTTISQWLNQALDVGIDPL